MGPWLNYQFKICRSKHGKVHLGVYFYVCFLLLLLLWLVCLVDGLFSSIVGNLWSCSLCNLCCSLIRYMPFCFIAYLFYFFVDHRNDKIKFQTITLKNKLTSREEVLSSPWMMVCPWHFLGNQDSLHWSPYITSWILA